MTRALISITAKTAPTMERNHATAAWAHPVSKTDLMTHIATRMLRSAPTVPAVAIEAEMRSMLSRNVAKVTAIAAVNARPKDAFSIRASLAPIHKNTASMIKNTIIPIRSAATPVNTSPNISHSILSPAKIHPQTPLVKHGTRA